MRTNENQIPSFVLVDKHSSFRSTDFATTQYMITYCEDAGEKCVDKLAKVLMDHFFAWVY